MIMQNDVSPGELYTEVFRDFLSETPEFGDFLNIATDHSRGRIWVMGGFIYRNIMEYLYGKLPEKQFVDIDFLVENYTRGREIKRPRGWEQELSHHGNLVFSKADGTHRISISSLKNFHSLVRRGLPPNIRHFYTGTPLDIQSITYDCDQGIVYGRRGINSISKRKIGVNNLEETKYEAGRRKISLERFVRQRAEELNFDYSLPESPRERLGNAFSLNS